VERLPQAVEDAANDLPLVLQTLRLSQQHPDTEGADVHRSDDKGE
jgi:hypothetical protein